MTSATRFVSLAVVMVVALSSAAEAGPPLICHPFESTGAPLLPWGTGPGWNTPAADYDLRRLTSDTLAILATDAPVLARMENLRRAVIYATRDHRIAEQLMTAMWARARSPQAGRLALFDAGYLIESYRQATHLFGRPMATADGYQLVTQALHMGPSDPAMEFAAALMTEGARSRTHLARARQAAASQPLLAENLSRVGW